MATDTTNIQCEHIARTDSGPRTGDREGEGEETDFRTSARRKREREREETENG